jgi:arsenite transporter
MGPRTDKPFPVCAPPPQVRQHLQVAKIAGVSLPIAVGLWLMMLPVLTKVKYELLDTLLLQRAAARQFTLSFLLNWALGPALMTALAWACLPDLPTYRSAGWSPALRSMSVTAMRT